MMRFLYINFLLLVCMVSPLFGQYQPHANLSGWSFVSSENVDVYYNNGKEAPAKLVAKYAELARFELGVLYDFFPKERLRLVYTEHAHTFQTSGFNLNERERESFLFHLPNKAGYVIAPGTTGELFSAVKEQISLLVLEELGNNDRLSGVIQNSLLFHNPLWFNKGLSEYVAYGWNYEDESWLNSVRSEDLISMAMEGDGHVNRIIRKSIWYFIAEEYGETKIAEIVYLVNVSHAIEAGIISVLGITLNTFTQRWREFILRISDHRQGRNEVRQLPGATLIPTKDGQTVSAFSYNGQSGKVALWLAEEGKHQLHIYDVQSKELKDLPVYSGFKSKDNELLDFDYSISWNPTKDELATTVYREGTMKLLYYDVETEEFSEHFLPDPLIKINQLAWSNNGEQLAAVASNGSYTDIYVAQASSGSFEALTGDLWDEGEIAWNHDDTQIYFSSNRNNLKDQSLDLIRESYENSYDLFAFNLAANKINRITQTPTVNERMPYAADAQSLYFISDESGINNIYRLRIGSAQVNHVSNLAKGLTGFDLAGNTFLLATPRAGAEKLFLVSKDKLSDARQPVATLLRLNKLTKFREAENKAQEIALREQRKNAKRVEIEKAQEEKPKEEKEAEVDEEEKQKTPRYYLFDEGDEPYEKKKADRLELESWGESERILTNVLGETQKPKWDELDVREQGAAINSWSVDNVSLQLKYDPIAKYGLRFGGTFSDLLNNHLVEVQVTPYINLRNGEGRARYTYQKMKINPYAEIAYGFNRFRRENFRAGGDSLIFQYNKFEFKTGVDYPLSHKLNVGLQAGYYNLQRRDLKLLRDDLLDESDHLVGAKAYLNFDNTEGIEGYFYRGIRANIGFDSYYSTQASDFAFHTAHAELQHFLTIYDRVVLASSIRGGKSFGEDINRQQFYLGGVEDWMLGVFFEEEQRPPLQPSNIRTSLYAFQFREFLSPIHGFGFSTREGTNYVLANFELRIPISRMVKQGLNAGALYNFELIPFFDAGTVWRQGNPFSQKNPTDTQIINSGPVSVQLQTLKSPFLFGFGAGVRTFILGYYVRADFGWGLDDTSLKRPIFSLSLGKGF